MRRAPATPDMFTPLRINVPDVIDIEVDGCDYSTLVPIAECTHTQRIVSIECALQYTINSHATPLSSWFHEFSFSISCVSLDESEPAIITQDRNIARNYIPDEIRNLVMPIVIQSCTVLIQRVRPRALYRVTKTRYPTAPALAKHELLTNRLRELGYGIYETGTDSFGRRFWLMALV